MNLACGSGTLLAERAGAGPFRLAFGCDIDLQALRCAQANLAAARVKVPVFAWDATRLPLAAGCIDVICADLPFGHDVGSHDENFILYPRILKEAARITKADARLVLLSHELRLMESILSRSGEWVVAEKIPITINGLHPHIYSLVKPPQ